MDCTGELRRDGSCADNGQEQEHHSDPLNRNSAVRAMHGTCLLLAGSGSVSALQLAGTSGAYNALLLNDLQE